MIKLSWNFFTNFVKQGHKLHIKSMNRAVNNKRNKQILPMQEK